MSQFRAGERRTGVSAYIGSVVLRAPSESPNQHSEALKRRRRIRDTPTTYRCLDGRHIQDMVIRQLVRTILHRVGRRKRESGVTPELPRSGEQERPPSTKH
jgi:hypothetical protein